MLSRNSPRALRALLQPTTSLRSVSSSSTTFPASATVFRSQTSRLSRSPQIVRARQFHATPLHSKGITPDSADPNPPTPQANNVAGGTTHVTEATPLSDEEYREYAETYLNKLQGALEETQEKGFDLEVEYSAGVLNVNVPGIGTYVLNKQPPNKQIWLSSPMSGPKRFDWVVRGDGMDEKEGTREYLGGQWIYLRDGTNLTVLLNSELGVNMAHDFLSD